MSDRSETQKLMPGREVTLASGRVVSIRELPLRAARRVGEDPRTSAFLADLAEEPTRDIYAVMRVALRHAGWWGDFLHRTTGLTADEVDDLPAREGFQVVLAAMDENPGFFVVGEGMRSAQATAGSPTSSPSSSGTGTETRPT